MTGRWGRLAAVTMLIWLGLAGCGSPAMLDTPDVTAEGYSYSRYDAAGGVRLHVLRTDPERIELLTVHDNVARARIPGINGGFFYNGDLLSIAVMDGIATAGKTKGYGSGWVNEKYARGTVVYDRENDTLNVHVVSSAQEIEAQLEGGYWAQGGISMSIGDRNWRVQADAEAAPFPDDRRLRSGMVYDREGSVYLVVSSTACTIEEFRSAVIAEVGEGKLVDGIFLDGDGSSQLASREELLPGDGRPVVQMVAIKS